MHVVIILLLVGKAFNISSITHSDVNRSWLVCNGWALSICDVVCYVWYSILQQTWHLIFLNTGKFLFYNFLKTEKDRKKKGEKKKG